MDSKKWAKKKQNIEMTPRQPCAPFPLLAPKFEFYIFISLLPEKSIAAIYYSEQVCVCGKKPDRERI